VAAMAAELGDVALERSALERQAEVLKSIGNEDAADPVLQRAASAMGRLEEGLPAELREGFSRHARNEPLKGHPVA
jgi:hypothetical protein